MPRLLAPSISSTSTSSPLLMLWQVSHWLQGTGAGPFSQFKALARILRRRCFAHSPRAGETDMHGQPDSWLWHWKGPGRRVPGRRVPRKPGADNAGQRPHTAVSGRILLEVIRLLAGDVDITEEFRVQGSRIRIRVFTV